MLQCCQAFAPWNPKPTNIIRAKIGSKCHVNSYCSAASTTSVPQAKTIYGSQLGVNGRPEIRSSRIPVQQISAVKKNNTQQLLNNGQKRPNSSNAKKVSMTQSRNRTTKQPPSQQPAALKVVQ